MIKIILAIMSFLALTTVQAMAQINPEAEKYISEMLNKKTPYQVTLLDYNFIINSVNSYPPGKLTEIFAKYLIDNNIIQNKVVADIGCACFPLGIIAIKNGANTVIGTDVNKYAVKCAEDNLALNHIQQQFYLFQGEELAHLLPNFLKKVDVILSGAPWDSISASEFENIKPERKYLSRAFYDIDE